MTGLKAVKDIPLVCSTKLLTIEPNDIISEGFIDRLFDSEKVHSGPSSV